MYGTGNTGANLHKKPCYRLSEWSVILWLDYYCSLHIRKTCHSNAKYMINCHKSYDYIAYYCFDSYQMLVNFKRHAPKIIRQCFHTLKSGKQKAKQESTNIIFITIIRLYEVKKIKYIIRKCKVHSNYNALTIWKTIFFFLFDLCYCFIKGHHLTRKIYQLIMRQTI
jgi:hypothetical protein